ncbi:ABC-type multidrug transport system, ATPase component [Methanocella conradii HZ254]|uniref:ABC-type multidrug transport system, ATPase component n=1 Tax=Methanocella conradii (strain DSM 24694 / JCM 17849 / CGMCC 1.5162 / HZ254) TaxID=1041930 RepID=H8I7B5_METCZ|nr:ABC transporter ATP-binding protein [Methanocella conradii]AFD00781.1 ABC-type multidrug transport system, ATPase component [Methanocella conradii HZ254]
MIKTENLTKVYDGVKAVDSLSLHVEKGDVFGFLGPNGSGKTTTMGMMIGEIEPTSGQCLIKGIDVLRHPLDVKKIIGYMPDGLGFYENLNARQNLKFFSQFYDIPADKAEKRITELLEYVGLAGVDKKTEGYSRGMKQRLGIAQALINDPEVIFMDEPTNGLDPQGVMQVRNIIKDLSSQGKTIFFSSHILEEVRQVCRTIGIISKGRLIAQGTLDEVRHKMQKEDFVTIVVKAPGTVPTISSPDIIDASYDNGTAVIRARSDIRDEISDQLTRNGVCIRELSIREKTLEEVFLQTVYGGARDEARGHSGGERV